MNSIIDNVLTRNNAYIRCADVDSDLYEFKDVAPTFNSDLPESVTYYKLKNDDNGSRHVTRTNMEAIRTYVENKFPVVHAITSAGFVVCGGFVTRLLIGEENYSAAAPSDIINTPDIDVFIISNVTGMALSDKIDALVRTIAKMCTTHQIKYDGRVITIDTKLIKIQIILRVYKSISQILHGFDLGSSCVAYDGNTVYFTSIGKFAYQYGYNIIDLEKRSTSYEYRLRKYFARGFDIIMPQFQMPSKARPIVSIKDMFELVKLTDLCEKLIDDTIIAMPYMTINDYKLDGTTIWTDPEMISMDGSVQSDYAPSDIGIEKYDEGISRANSRNIINGHCDRLVYWTWPYDASDLKAYNLMKLSCLISHQITNKTMFNIMKIVQPDGDFDSFETTVSKFVCHVRDREVGLLHDNGYAFNVTNPTTQQYGIHNPVIEDPINWYGAYYAPQHMPQ
jgi:hypothetical protein